MTIDDEMLRKWLEAAVESAFRAGAAEERAAVVAWLREQISAVMLHRVDDVSVDAASAGVAMLLTHVSNIIERGEHIGAAKGGMP